MALESLWRGVCTVYIQEETQNTKNKRIEFTEKAIYTDEPCKLSFENITTTVESSNAASVVQKAKLFLAPEVDIPPGSKITVTQNGKTADYEKSGEPATYTYHQEVYLDLFKGWA
jgi:hypothetical protein